MGKHKHTRLSADRFDPAVRLPEPDVLLFIHVAENKDSVGGGVAIFGKDGRWYWAYNGKKDYECIYTVKDWDYLYEEDAVAAGCDPSPASTKD